MAFRVSRDSALPRAARATAPSVTRSSMDASCKRKRPRSGLTKKEKRKQKAALAGVEAPGGPNVAWEGGDLGFALGSSCELHKRAEAWSSVTLWEVHQ